MTTIKMLAILFAFVSPGLAAFGPAFSTGPTSSGVFIVDARSTLIVPTGNLPFFGDFSLWCGMGTSTGDLIQSIVERTPNNAPVTTPCETVATETEWCGYTYVLNSDGYQDIGTEARVNAYDRMTFRYVYQPTTGNYTQRLKQNGTVISQKSTSSGEALGWGTATECAANDCGTFPSHRWVNTVITLSAADPAYNSTSGFSPGVISSGFFSPDNGLTWKVKSITIPEFTYTG